MPNLRIVSDNALDRAATLVASTTSGLLAASNLLNDRKSMVWRATVMTATTLTATWANGETLSCAALAHCNLSPTSTIRVQCYDATSAGVLLLDTNTLQPNALACPAPARVPHGYTAAQAASAYANGGGAYARIWFAPTSGVKRMVVTITDSGNLQGYIEAARLIAGQYWSPTINASAAPMTPVDTTAIYYNDAGEQLAEAGTIRRKVSIDLNTMPEPDRAVAANMLMNSRAHPIFLSIYPESAFPALERDHMVYGRRTKDSSIDVQNSITYGITQEVEEV